MHQQVTQLFTATMLLRLNNMLRLSWRFFVTLAVWIPRSVPSRFSVATLINTVLLSVAQPDIFLFVFLLRLFLLSVHHFRFLRRRGASAGGVQVGEFNELEHAQLFQRRVWGANAVCCSGAYLSSNRIGNNAQLRVFNAVVLEVGGCLGVCHRSARFGAIQAQC